MNHEYKINCLYENEADIRSVINWHNQNHLQNHLVSCSALLFQYGQKLPSLLAYGT